MRANGYLCSDKIKTEKMPYRIVRYVVLALALLLFGGVQAQSHDESISLVERCREAQSSTIEGAEQIAAYTKIEVGVPSRRAEFGWHFLQERFGFVLENVDSTSVANAPYLPVFQVEINSILYRRSEPAFNYEQLCQVRMAGIDEEYAVTNVADLLPQAIDFYADRIEVLGRELCGPLDSENYRYRLVAPSRIAFEPIDVEGFTGEMTIDDGGQLRSITANYELFALGVGKREVTVSVRCEVVYDDPQPIGQIPANVVRAARQATHDYQLSNDEQSWIEVRQTPLTKREQATFAMVDSVVRTPFVRDLYSIANAIASGYYDRGVIGWGPYYKILGFNRLEDVRFQYGLRTTDMFSRHLRLTGYAAYGVRDAALKGGGAIEIALGSVLQRKLTLAARHDLVQLGAARNPFVEDNIARNSLVRSNKARASMCDQVMARYDHEWREGFQTGIGLNVNKLESNAYVPMMRSDSTRLSALNSATIALSARLSWREMMLRRYFDHYSLGSQYPIVALDAEMGIKGMLGNEQSFARVEANAFYRLPMGRAGMSQLIINAGGVIGRVPYPLLKIHAANGSYLYDRQAFSCMNYLEFASDAWVGWFYEHHFKGLVLGNIPLVKRLRWREVVSFRGVWGTLRPNNMGSAAPLLLPEGMIAPRHPYMEAGVGIENIFKVLRVDAIWRLTHRDRVIEGRGVDRFRVNVSFQLQF